MLDSDKDEMVKIGRLILTQDNRITDQPIFIVQQKRQYITNPDYNDGYEVWLDDEGNQVDRAEGVEKVYVHDVWEFVTACFTEQGCKDYIARDGHNLREPRIYAAGSFRNEEWRTVRKFLLSLAATPQPDSAAPGGDERARELLRDQYIDKFGHEDAYRIFNGPWSMEEDAAIRAITAALSTHAPGGGENAPLDAVYAKFEAMDNQDVPLEQYPQAAVNALAHAGWAIVPCCLPFELLGESARSGMMETGNPKHVWDYLISKTRLYPAPITTPIADAIKPEQVDTEARARELLAAEYERMGYKALVTGVREFPFEALSDGDEAALLAIIAALSAPKQVGDVYLDFEQIGTAGPFKIQDGRVYVPAITSIDIHAKVQATAITDDASPQAVPVPVEGEGPELPPRLALLPTQAEALTAADRALADAENAIKVLSTMLKNRQLQGYMVADEIWGSVKQARILIAGATPPPSQPAVELDGLRKAISDELRSLAGAMNDWRKTELVHRSLDSLLALIDGAKAAPSPWRPINELPQTDDLFWFLRGDTVDGPRAPQIGLFDADQWDWFAPCKWPSTSSIIDGAKAGRAGKGESAP